MPELSLGQFNLTYRYGIIFSVDRNATKVKRIDAG